ncbi:MAG: hypothetical protein NC222_06410 [Staphylococcus sp.]|nr:hypothetical protein [Staphylococcus sp.]
MKYIKFIPYLLIIFLFVRVSYLNKQNILLKNKTATLEKNLSKKTVIYKDKIIYKEREVSGTSIKQETVYIPSEGKVEILTPTDGNKLDLSLIDKVFNKVIKQEDGTIVLIQNRGFSLAPEISGMYSNEFELGLQIKILYWDRYSTGIGFTDKQTLYGFINRNISDIFNFTKNTNLQFAIGKNFKEQETRFLIGVSVRL